MRMVLWVTLHVRRDRSKFFRHLHDPKPSRSRHAAANPIWKPPRNTGHPWVPISTVFAVWILEKFEIRSEILNTMDIMP